MPLLSRLFNNFTLKYENNNFFFGNKWTAFKRLDIVTSQLDFGMEMKFEKKRKRFLLDDKSFD